MIWKFFKNNKFLYEKQSNFFKIVVSFLLYFRNWIYFDFQSSRNTKNNKLLVLSKCDYKNIIVLYLLVLKN